MSQVSHTWRSELAHFRHCKSHLHKEVGSKKKRPAISSNDRKPINCVLVENLFFIDSCWIHFSEHKERLERERESQRLCFFLVVELRVAQFYRRIHCKVVKAKRSVFAHSFFLYSLGALAARPLNCTFRYFRIKAGAVRRTKRSNFVANKRPKSNTHAHLFLCINSQIRRREQLTRKSCANTQTES